MKNEDEKKWQYEMKQEKKEKNGEEKREDWNRWDQRLE